MALLTWVVTHNWQHFTLHSISGVHPPKANDAYSPFPSPNLPTSDPSPNPPFSHPSPPLPSLRSRHPLIQLGGLGSAVNSPSGSGLSPAAKRYLMHLGLQNASGESNFKCTFTSVKLFECDFVITLLAFRPLLTYLLTYLLLSKAVNRLPRIYNNKLKFSPFWGFLSPHT